MTYTGRLGNHAAAPGNVVLGAGGSDGSSSTTASALVIGSFTAHSAVSAHVLATRATSAGTNYAVTKGTWATGALVTTVTVKQGVAAALVTAYVGAHPTVTAPATALLTATRNDVVPVAIAVKPADPEVYTGRVPRTSTRVQDILALLPQYFDNDPEAVTVFTLSAPGLIETTTTLVNAISKTDGIMTVSDGTGFPFGQAFLVSLGTEVVRVTSRVTIDTWIIERGQRGTTPGEHDRSERVSNLPSVVTLRVDGLYFEARTTDDSLPPFSCDLRDFTIGALCNTLTLGGFTAIPTTGYESLAATILIDNTYREDAYSPTMAVQGYTAALWQVMRPLVLMFDVISDDVTESVRQMDVRYAEGRWLDWWGVLYGIVRHKGETDLMYRRRITWETMSPRANNVAMESIIKEALGYDAAITDEYGAFLTWYGPFAGHPGWDTQATYNSTTYTWSGADLSPVMWGMTNPTSASRPGGYEAEVPALPFSALVEQTLPSLLFRGRHAQFHVAINQVVEEGQLGQDDLVALINRYKAAGMQFRLSLTTYYQEAFATTGATEDYAEDLGSSLDLGVGTFLIMNTMSSLTWSDGTGTNPRYPPVVEGIYTHHPPVFESKIYGERLLTGMTTWVPDGNTDVVQRIVDPTGALANWLGAEDTAVFHPPGVYLPG